MVSQERLASHVAVREAETYLRDRRRDITMVDVGKSERRESQGKLVVRFHVKRRLEVPQLESLDLQPVPHTIRGFSSEVNVHAYRLHAAMGWPPSARSRNDPMIGGISISDDRSVSAGTLGAIVHDRESGAPLILSNFHVIAGGWGGVPGTPGVLQPGSFDGGTRRDLAGRFLRHAMDSHLDAAVAGVEHGRGTESREFGIGVVRGRTTASIGQCVTKYGRTTGLTAGVITGFAGSGMFMYSGVSWLIRNILTIDPPDGGGELSGAGDSGSCWLDPTSNQAVGLHFAGQNTPERALALDMRAVCEALGVDV